jgi:peptidoglycan/xylan/chitin deacetylase (PgdA/CDA1 family)
MKEIFFNNYQKIKKQKSKGFLYQIRVIIRLFSINFVYLVLFIIDFFVGMRKRPRIQFLYLHFIFEDQEKKLFKLLNKLTKEYTFISYTEGFNMILSRQKIDKPYICLSTDDGLKNNLKFAEILDQFGINACFFVCPEVVNNASDFDYVSNFAKEQLHLPPVEFMNWDDIIRLKEKGHEIGGHTMSHKNLADCNEDMLINEILPCYKSIKEKLGMVKHFSWPYGRFFHFSEDAKKIVFDSGFESIASAERGAHFDNFRGDKFDLCLRRDHISLDWSINEIKYFILRGSIRKNKDNFNLWM